MSDARKSLGLAGIGVLAIVCCAGLPLILAAGLSAAVLAWAGGLAAGLIALGFAVAFLVVRARRRSCAVPSTATRRSLLDRSRLLRAWTGQARS